MYAVIETGGKQYRVELGTELAVERLDAVPGTSIDFDRVLLVADGDSAQIGTPTVAEALVTADVLRQDRGDKIIVFKYRPKARHRSKKGHRQEQTILRVADIRFNGRSAADEAGKSEAKEKTARKAAQVEAERKAAADQELAAKLAADAVKADAKTKAAEAEPAKETKTAPKATKPAAAKATKTAPKTTKAATAKADEAAPAEDKPKAKATTRKPAATKAAPKTTKAAPAETSDKPKTSTRARTTRTSTKKGE